MARLIRSSAASCSLLRGNHCVDRADFQRVFGAVFLAGGDPLDGVVGTDQARQTHRAAEAWVDAQLDFRQTDFGTGRT